MERDAIWQAFADTGDPMYYLLYKSTQDQKPEDKKRTRNEHPGELPRSEA